MTGVLIDSNVILDLFEEDSEWVEWSEATLHKYSYTHTMYINPIIYSEVFFSRTLKVFSLNEGQKQKEL